MMVDRQVLEDLIADALGDSMGPDWSCRVGASAVADALFTSRLLTARHGPVPGSNEWLAQSPQFHPGDIA